ncbi:3'(2'),5'-bisphosphate nucleotidase CysQ [Bacteroidia bacterium]|nr:3'(2'),5'-bisphosphate nucleotidase CysQ [Bacteroidia bacterium]
MKLVIDDIDVTCAIEAAYAAGDAIMHVYNSADFGIEIKSDKSPLTIADKNAHHLIVDGLKQTNIPVLSEEGDDIPYATRSKWALFWMVDPLDGTKEFIKRNGEFTVNIALIKNGKPIFGVVYSPVNEKMYYGGTSMNKSYIETARKSPVELKQITPKSIDYLGNLKTVRVVTSRSHQTHETLNFIGQYLNTELLPMGSSLKFIVLAEGEADVYPRYAPCMEWDTAAAHAILQGVGADIYQIDEHKNGTNQRLKYNKENLLNPNFISY